MTTFAELVDQVSVALHSYTTQEKLTWLSSSLTNSATSFSVADGEQVSLGVIEVDDELMYVSSVATNTVTLAPFGRGYRGSVAATHAANAKVTFDPHFPRVDVKRAITQIMAAVYPQLYQIKETTFTFAGAQATYELPADTAGVVKVQYQVTGPSGYWQTLTTWEFEPNSELATGKALTLHEAPEQQRTVKVVYRAPFGTLAADADTLDSVGFPESAIDVLIYGAAARLIRFLDVARLQMRTVENGARAEFVRSGDPSNIANQFYAMHVTRLQEERKKLLELEPPQMYFTR